MVWIIDEKLSGLNETDSTSDMEPSYLTHEFGLTKEQQPKIHLTTRLTESLIGDVQLNLPGRQQSQKT